MVKSAGRPADFVAFVSQMKNQYRMPRDTMTSRMKRTRITPVDVNAPPTPDM
jgi:hypothetical protein